MKTGPEQPTTAESTIGRLDDAAKRAPACPACGGLLVEIKQKLQCSRCRMICETCCEGGRG